MGTLILSACAMREILGGLLRHRLNRRPRLQTHHSRICTSESRTSRLDSRRSGHGDPRWCRRHPIVRQLAIFSPALRARRPCSSPQSTAPTPAHFLALMRIQFSLGRRFSVPHPPQCNMVQPSQVSKTRHSTKAEQLWPINLGHQQQHHHNQANRNNPMRPKPNNNLTHKTPLPPSNP